MTQKVLFWNDEPLEMSVLGEKPHKLMLLKQAGFSVPDFCTIVSDGSGEITLDDSVRSAFQKLRKPLIARSAHPMEGGGFSFSGIFQSIERVTRLEDAPEDMVNYENPFEREDLKDKENIYDLYDEWMQTRTLSLDMAYSEILQLADEKEEYEANSDVKRYLKLNGIEGFNHKDMNLLLMEQRNVQVFGMFMTSSQQNPNEIVIHYQDRRTDKGNFVVYDKKTEALKTKIEGDLESILTEFGKTAAKVEQKFGKVQQVEMGYSDNGVEIYQSRDLNLGNSASTPRFAHYKTFSTDLHADGFGYFHLPVLVIDNLENFSDKTNSLSFEERIEKVVKPYKAEIKKFIEKHPEYIVVVKDGDLFSSFYSGKTDLEIWEMSRKERYSEINEITRRAKVIFKGTNQNAIRHEDWDNVESGGINIWMREDGKVNNLFVHKTGNGKYKFPDYEKPFSPTVTLLSSHERIKTGDYLHVLSNTDGLFVWRD